jgi:hypothetical protein
VGAQPQRGEREEREGQPAKKERDRERHAR